METFCLSTDQVWDQTWKMQFFKQKYPQNVSIATKSILRCCADKKMSVYLGENTQVIDFFKYYLKI